MFLIAFKVDWTQSRDKRLELMVCNAMRPRSPLSHLMIKSLFFLQNPRLSWCSNIQSSSDFDIPKKGHLCERPSGVGGLLRLPRCCQLSFQTSLCWRWPSVHHLVCTLFAYLHKFDSTIFWRTIFFQSFFCPTIFIPCQLERHHWSMWQETATACLYTC